jgi:hypothetical protein
MYQALYMLETLAVTSQLLNLDKCRMDQPIHEHKNE